MSILNSSRCGKSSLTYIFGLNNKIEFCASVLYSDLYNKNKYVMDRPHRLQLKLQQYNQISPITIELTIEFSEVMRLFESTNSMEVFVKTYKSNMYDKLHESIKDIKEKYNTNCDSMILQSVWGGYRPKDEERDIKDYV